ncbi:MAG: hypothetical protein AB1767_05310 [Bacillota bacterium]
MQKSSILEYRLQPQQIARKREAVRRAFIAASKNITGGNITRMADSDLKILFELYDALFLEHFWQKNFKGSLTFSLSTRMSRSAGKVISPRNLADMRPGEERFEMRISVDLFFHYNELNRAKVVNGITTEDALEAFQLVFEHELCHLLELHVYKQSSCRHSRFKTIAVNLFGHTESYHLLPTMREIAGEKFGLQVGDTVCFTWEGRVLEGEISGITKRATVMVRDKKGEFRDPKGRRYTKWYVPLSRLHKKK